MRRHERAPSDENNRLGRVQTFGDEVLDVGVARRQLGQQVGKLHGQRIAAVHRRREVQRLKLTANGVEPPAVSHVKVRSW